MILQLLINIAQSILPVHFRKIVERCLLPALDIPQVISKLNVVHLIKPSICHMLMQQYRIVDNEHPVVAFLDIKSDSAHAFVKRTDSLQITNNWWNIFVKSVDRSVIWNALSDQVPGISFSSKGIMLIVCFKLQQQKVLPHTSGSIVPAYALFWITDWLLQCWTRNNFKRQGTKDDNHMYLGTPTPMELDDVVKPSSSTFGGKCFKYGERGHRKRDCPKRVRQQDFSKAHA